MKNSLYKAMMDNKYKGDERQIKIRNSVFSKGFIGLCIALMLYSSAESIIYMRTEIHLNTSMFPLSNPIFLIIGLCCFVMTFVLCKKGAFFGYSNGVLIVGCFSLVPFGLTSVIHYLLWDVFVLPSFCNDWQFGVLNTAVNLILPLAVVLAEYFSLNMLYKRNSQ